MFMTYRRRLATLGTALLLCTTPFCHAADADPQAMERLFEAQGLPALIEQGVAAVEAEQAQTVAREADPARKARLQKAADIAVAAMRGYMTWDKIKPLAVECYLQVLSAEDVQAMSGFYASPTGQLTVHKLAPALTRASADLTAELDHKVEAIFEAPQAPAGKQKAKAPWRPSNAREAVAGQLADELLRADFEQEMKSIDTVMQSRAVSSLKPADAKRIAAGLKRELSYDYFKAAAVKVLAAGLTEAELGELLRDNRLPERRAQRDKLHKAGDVFQARLNDWMTAKVLPELLKTTAAP